MGRPVHSRVILPNEAARQGRLTIHVPSGYEDERERMADPDGAGYMVCRVVVDQEQRLMCGKLFEAGQERAFERHVGKCALEHIDQIRAASPRTRMPMLDPNAWDPQVEEHMREVGRRMIREGRLEVKPSERAGF